MDFASTTSDFLTAIETNIGDMLPAVLAFVAAIMVWGVLKKWIFGGTSRI